MPDDPPANPSPRRPWLRWTLATGLLPACIVAFYLIENHRGERAWTEQKTKLAAAGISLDFYDYLHFDFSTPDHENVFAAEPYSRFIADSGSAKLGFEVVLKDIFYVQPGSFSSARCPSFHNDNPSQFPVSNPLPEDPTEASKELLRRLAPHDPELAAIRAAAARPHIHYEIGWRDGYPRWPSLSPVLNITKLLSFRCTALLTLDRSAEALEDLKLLLRQAEITQKPTLIGLMIEQGFQGISIHHVWHGLAKGVWTDAQLQELDRLYRGLDPAVRCIAAIGGEHAITQALLDRYAEDRRSTNRELAQMLGYAKGDIFGLSSGWEEYRLRFIAMLIPHGWIRQNQASYAADVLSAISELRSSASQPGLSKATPSTSTASPPPENPSIFKQVTNTLLPPQRTLIDKHRQFIANLALLRTAIALEQHHRTTGSFPATLSELKSPPPPDPITGAPLHYERLPDAKRFKLWSVALNGIDDGG
ncbi:MAG TPA: hypothetical protein VD994_22090 [Prosthecobacter sp.]|nr:hypothetical protein [Prosthecobacter sp.]